MLTRDRLPAFITTSCILFIFWLLLSGLFDLVHLTFGVISAFLVSYLSSNLLIGDKKMTLKPEKIILFFSYLIYLIYNIVLSNIDVAYRVLHPSMPINPKIVELKTALDSDIGQTALANSITLTPGTITVNISDGIVCVHALSPKTAEKLLCGELEKKLVRVFK